MLRARLALLLLVLAAHWPDLSGYLSSNPLTLVSGLRLDWSGGLLPGMPGWIDWHAGATQQALGTLAARDWLHGIIPWWNPYVGVGMPLGGQPQASAFFLPFILLDHFSDGTAYLKITMQVIAGQAAFALLRHLGLGRAAALTGGALYELGGMFAWFGDAPMLPLAFLPVLVLGIEQAADAARQRAPGGWALIAMGIGYLVLAGFPETAYLSGLLALGWAVVRLTQLPGARRAFATKISAGGITGLLIAAPFLLAFAAFMLQAWPEPRDNATAHLLGANFAQLLFPYLLGPLHYQKQYDIWFRLGGYLGATPLLLGLAGLIGGGRHRRLAWFLAAWVALAVAKSAALPGVTQAINLLPAMTQILAFRYAAPTLTFAACVLAGLAMDGWQSGTWRRTAPGWAALGLAGLSVLVLALALPVIRSLSAQPGYWLYPAVSLCGASCIAGVITLLLARRATQPRVAAVCALTVLEAFVLFSLPLLSGGRRHAIDTEPVAFLQKHLGLDRFYSIGPIGPNYGAYFDIASINHNYLPLSQRWSDFVTRRLAPDTIPNIFNGTTPDAASGIATLQAHLASYQETGVRYVVAYSGTNPFPTLAGDIPAKVFSDPLVSIYELPHPKAYFETTSPGCTLQDFGRQRVHGYCAQPGTLVRRELYDPGWTAAVNGAAAPLRPRDEVFQAVDVPSGAFSVQFRYAPPYVWAAYAGCVLGLVILAREGSGSFLKKRTKKLLI